MKTAIPQFLIAALIVCLASVQSAQAVVPPPDGGYPGNNTAEGENALLSLTIGVNNTAVGWSSLKSNRNGQLNTAVGAGTLYSARGSRNTAIGGAALFSDINGESNTAVGALALWSNTTGSLNTAIGDNTLFSNTVGFQNTAVGGLALVNNITGNANVAIGSLAAYSNFTGGGNTVVGEQALFDNQSGNYNIAIGFSAGGRTTGSNNTAIGVYALLANTTGSSNVAIGDDAGNNVESGSNIICIGASVLGDDVSDTTWIGNIYGVATLSGTTAPVVVSDTGQLGTVISSERFKKDIAIMGQASEGILSLQPVTFQYKTDGTSTPQFGLIAEEVAKVNPALVVPDKEGKPYTVRYDAVNAMLLNEFLKEHRKNEEQEKTIAELKSGMTALAATVKEQASQIQKVSAQLEVTKSAPQTAQNNAKLNR